MKFKLLFILFIFNFLPLKDSSISMNDIIFEAKKLLFYKDIQNKPFNENFLIQCIYFEKIKNPDIVLIQARLETGFYTSDIFLKGNNLFGMKYPKYRKTNAIGVYKKHAHYNNWIDSVKDYKTFQIWYTSLGFKVDQYLVFLQYIKYAKDPQYIPKIQKLFKDYS